MRQEIKIDDINPPKRGKVFHHLKIIDYLMIVGPMAAVVIALFVWTVTTPDDSIMLGPAVALASVILSVLFCGAYSAFSLILSLLTMRNTTFRLGLVAGLLSMAGALFMFFRYI